MSESALTPTYTVSPWSLADLFPAQDSPEIQAAFANLDEQAAAFEKQRLSLSATMSLADFLAIVLQLEAIQRLSYRIYGYASLSFAANTQDQSAQTFLGQVQHKMAALENRDLFFSLPLAETASTFGEMILVDRLLEQEEDEAVRRDLLFRQLDDAYATIGRQAFFALFERQAHEMIVQGTAGEDLSQAYLLNLQEQFGEAVEISDEFRWEWVSIPHIFHVPFYVYVYTFGQLLVLEQLEALPIEGKPA